jgi:rhodanese-related sulfurtransferase
MSKKRRSTAVVHQSDRRGAARTQAPPERPGFATDRRAQLALLVVVMILVAIVVIGSDFVIGAVTGGSGQATPTGTATATATVATAAGPTQFGVIKPGIGGHWTNVSADQLAQMLQKKDFTLINVKTPYMGEIDGTDLYIPYDQLKGRASELPGDKGAKILVYCRSGGESAVAAQTLLDLGYTNVWNLDGGMNAWTASGRQLIQKNR